MHPRYSDYGLVMPGVLVRHTGTTGRMPGGQHELEGPVEPVASISGGIHS